MISLKCILLIIIIDSLYSSVTSHKQWPKIQEARGASSKYLELRVNLLKHKKSSLPQEELGSSKDLKPLRRGVARAPSLKLKRITMSYGAALGVYSSKLDTKQKLGIRQGVAGLSVASAMGLSSRVTRTTPYRVSFAEDCDYIAHYCMRAYDTGILCGRTLYNVYHDFKNMCMLDFVNCMERYEVWQVAHMGECIKLTPLQDYRHYPYENDYFLDNYYVVEDL